MTNYLEKYREALRAGDEEKANELYNKYKGEDSSESEESEQSGESEDLKSPISMNVSEAKDYADELDEEATKKFLEMEKEEKDRKSLVSYLE